MGFAQLIKFWYKKNKRKLPFRENASNPYKVWISEIILQQTQLIQGLPYYIKFIKKYPNIQALAAANEQDILNSWQGLGYYSRARNLHASAIHIAQKLKGKFPDNYRDIIKLKGIGPYTAAAISSICFEEPVLALDGNGYRFLSRYFGMDDCIDEAQGKKNIYTKGQKLVPKNNPGDFNQAIIEIGALICRPRNPDCDLCPVQRSCVAYKLKLINVLPVRKKKTKSKHLFLYYLFIKGKQGKFLLNKRTEKGIWKNMFDLPLLQSQKKLALKNIPESEFWSEFFKHSKPIITSVSKEHKHILSHQILHTRFFTIEVESLKHFPKSYIRVKPNELSEYPLPRLIDKFFQQDL